MICFSLKFLYFLLSFQLHIAAASPSTIFLLQQWLRAIFIIYLSSTSPTTIGIGIQGPLPACQGNQSLAQESLDLTHAPIYTFAAQHSLAPGVL